jgi:hypothetical protein
LSLLQSIRCFLINFLFPYLVIAQVVKENQILQKGDITIDHIDENTTLVDVNIFAGDQIIVRDSEIHENRDIAGKLFDNFTL